MELTKKQEKAIKALEKALKMCDKEKIYFHNCYGTLIAFDATVVKDVNDTKSTIPCEKGRTVKNPYTLDSWADDSHYVHLKEGV